MPKQEPSETMCTHCGEVRAFALRGCSRRRLPFSRGALPHFLLIKCPLSFRLFLLHTPGYLALLPASEFYHRDKPLLSLLRPIGSCQSQLFFPRCCYSVLNGEAQLGEKLLRVGSYDDGRLVFCKLANAGDNSTRLSLQGES